MGFVGQALERPRNLSINEYLRRAVEPTWAGVNVNSTTALRIAAVFGCTRVISEDIGKLPFEVYQQNSDRERTRATASPFWKLIHDKPNSYQTSQQFREYLTASALLRGNGFARKNIIQGQVRELLPLHPDRVRLEQLGDSELVYHVTGPDGTEQLYSRRDIFHLPGLTIDGPAGVSVVTHARQSLGISLASERHAATFFGNGLHSSGIFKHPKLLGDKAYERLKKDLRDKTGGRSNELLLIEEGMDFTPITMTNVDSQFLESRTFEVVEICRWFRVPPHKIAELSRATFSNIEHQAMEYVTDTLMPWAKRWEYAVNQQAIVTNGVFAELNFDALLRGATLERYQAYQIAAGGNAPWMSRNELRRRENLSPIDGLDEMLTPLNMQGNNQAGQPAQQEAKQ